MNDLNFSKYCKKLFSIKEFKGLVTQMKYRIYAEKDEELVAQLLLYTDAFYYEKNYIPLDLNIHLS